MSTYAAFLGNHPRISIAELAATLPGFSFKKMVGSSIALFATEAEIKQKHLDRLGSIILIAQEVDGVKSLADVPAALQRETSAVKGKVTFSLRAYGVNRQHVFGLYRDGKKYLVKQGRSVRYVGNERQSAAAALLHDSGIVDGKHGCEIVLLGDEDKWLWVGRTVAVQNPDAYTKRDMEKPVRDTRVGLLPPKLAQILLNFGEWAVQSEKPKKKLTILDPFCGTGVVPMEALLRGWQVLASDLSLKAVNGSQKNLDWVRKEYGVLKKDVSSTVWKQDASNPFSLKENPDMIVTETTLGPALSKRPTVKDVTKMRNEADKIEVAFLRNVATSLPGVPVVATFPVWYVGTGPVFLEKVWTELAEIGFEAVLPVGVESETPEHPSLIYRRPDQFVGRQVVILRPVAKQ